MCPGEYYLRIGNEIRKIWGWNQFIYPENRSNDRYPFFNRTTIRNAIPFNSNHLDSFSFYGCKLGEKAAFVPWIDNKISVYNTFPNRIAVSFGFSGCYMVKYFFKSDVTYLIFSQEWAIVSTFGTICVSKTGEKSKFTHYSVQPITMIP